MGSHDVRLLRVDGSIRGGRSGSLSFKKCVGSSRLIPMRFGEVLITFPCVEYLYSSR